MSCTFARHPEPALRVICTEQKSNDLLLTRCDSHQKITLEHPKTIRASGRSIANLEIISVYPRLTLTPSETRVEKIRGRKARGHASGRVE